MLFVRRSVKEARLFIKAAAKVLDNRRDLMSEASIADIETASLALKTALKEKASDATLKDRQEKLEKACNAVLPRYKHPVIREYCEVFLVAMILAAGIRAYFLQPFKIPTGSMQPTLNGIIGYPQENVPPALPKRIFDKLVLGRTYMNIVATKPERIVDVQLVTQNFFVTRSAIITETGQYIAPVPPATLIEYFKVRRGRSYAAGEPIVRGYSDTGDQVFVDKMTYHFFKPNLGDVFVFRTTGIRGIEDGFPPNSGSQYYIKRIGGVPGVELRIAPPDLFVNGVLPDVFGLRRVMSLENGYKGYANGSASGMTFPYLGSPTATFKVPEHAYIALGDNSFNSLDSRSWGIVPEDNVVGRGFLVYWPFTSHWGGIR